MATTIHMEGTEPSRSNLNAKTTTFEELNSADLAAHFIATSVIPKIQATIITQTAATVTGIMGLASQMLAVNEQSKNIQEGQGKPQANSLLLKEREIVRQNPPQVVKMQEMQEMIDDDSNCQKIIDDLSQEFGFKVSPFDIFLLFTFLMKLKITHQEQEKLSRRQEREQQVMHMKLVVENFKTNAKWQLSAGVLSGVFAIASGAIPIIGHMKGTAIIDKFSTYFTSLKGVDKDKFFEGISKMTYAASEMQKSTGQIQNTFSEGDRTHDQHISDLARTDGDLNTRSIEEVQQEWQGIMRFLDAIRQEEYDATRSLYN